MGEMLSIGWTDKTMVLVPPSFGNLSGDLAIRKTRSTQFWERLGNILG